MPTLARASGFATYSVLAFLALAFCTLLTGHSIFFDFYHGHCHGGALFTKPTEALLKHLPLKTVTSRSGGRRDLEKKLDFFPGGYYPGKAYPICSPVGVVCGALAAKAVPSGSRPTVRSIISEMQGHGGVLSRKHRKRWGGLRNEGRDMLGLLVDHGQLGPKIYFGVVVGVDIQEVAVHRIGRRKQDHAKI